MARIVLGLGTSHTPMLLVDAADLPRYEENDRRLRLLDNDGVAVTYETLLAAQSGRYEEVVTAERLSARHIAAGRALDRLADTVRSAKLDALVVIGDDQKEMIRDDHPPSLLIYDRPVVRSQRPPHPPGRPEWVLRGSDRYYPADGGRDYPVAQRLAHHLQAELEGRGLPVAGADAAGETVPIGHAFAFVHSQILRDASIPVVPVLLNALYPPAQPTPGQCVEIGEAIAAAVAAFPEAARVGVVASGGLSHFVVDEQLDRTVVRALADRDLATLRELALNKLDSGNAEIRNWICTAAAVTSLQVEKIEYIPAYRTRAGTGVGLCFATWQ